MPRTIVVVVAAALLLGAAGPAAPPDYPVEYLKVDEVKDLLDRGEAVDLIDVRTVPEFEETHIKGARSIPLRTVAQRLGEIPKNRLVVFY